MKLLLILLITLVPVSAGRRILLVTVPGKSHVHYFATAGRELAQRGHEVHVLLSTSAEGITKDLTSLIGPSMTVHHLSGDMEDPFKNEEEMAEKMKGIISFVHKFRISNLLMLRIMGFMMDAACRNVLIDSQLFIKLKELQFDFAMIDGFPGLRCQYVLLYRLGIPYVSLTTQYEPWLYGIPAPPSFVPLAIQHDYSEKMTFFQRVRNFLSYIEWHTIPLMYSMSGYYTSKFAPDLPYKTPNQLAAESAIWFINTDIAIDYPRPTLPHVIEVGGLTTKAPEKALPEEFQSFMDESGEEGVILVSFGSAPGFPDELEKLIHDTVLGMKLRVIWKTAAYNLTSDSVITNKWIPQNAILAHPKTKLFITHGGNNGQFEALYHAVPMVVIPLFGDQFYNAQRIQYKGYGLTKDAFGTTVDELLNAVDEVLNNPGYKENITRGSDIYKSHPMNPRERLVFWMEHVMEYGSQHLHSFGLEMPWYQYWMIDILAFLFVCFAVSSIAIFRIIKLFCKRPKKDDKREKKD